MGSAKASALIPKLTDRFLRTLAPEAVVMADELRLRRGAHQTLRLLEGEQAQRVVDHGGDAAALSVKAVEKNA